MAKIRTAPGVDLHFYTDTALNRLTAAACTENHRDAVTLAFALRGLVRFWGALLRDFAALWPFDPSSRRSARECLSPASLQLAPSTSCEAFLYKTGQAKEQEKGKELRGELLSRRPAVSRLRHYTRYRSRSGNGSHKRRLHNSDCFANSCF